MVRIEPPTATVYGAPVGNVVSWVAPTCPLQALPVSFTAKKVVTPLPAAAAITCSKDVFSDGVALPSHCDQLLLITVTPCSIIWLYIRSSAAFVSSGPYS